MIVINLFLSIAIPLLAGQLLLWVLFGRKYFPLSFSLALAYGLGLGALTQVMLVLGICKIAFSVPVISLVLSSAVFLIFLYSRRRQGYPAPRPLMPFPQPFALSPLFIFIIYYVIIVFWRAFNIPVYSWDVISSIAFKAKVFFYQRGLVPLHILPHPAYPLHMPLLQAWITLNLNEWSDQWINLLLPFTFCAYLIVHYHFLKILTNQRWASLGTALLVGSQNFVSFAMIPYQEFLLLYYNCVALMLLILWRKEQIPGLLILTGLFSGFMTFTKTEGAAYLGMHLSLLGFILWRQTLSLREKLKHFAMFASPALGLFLFYFIFKVSEGLLVPEEIGTAVSLESCERIPQLLAAFADTIFLSGEWNITWFLFIVSFLNLFRKKLTGEMMILTIAVAMFFGFYLLIGFLSDHLFNWMVPPLATNTLPRIFLHFFPLAALLIVLLNFPEKSSEAGTR